MYKGSSLHKWQWHSYGQDILISSGQHQQQVPMAWTRQVQALDRTEAGAGLLS